MRRVLDQTPVDAIAISDLAGDVYGTDTPTRAQVESVRRASKRLAEQGRLELDYVWAPHLHPSWISPPEADGPWSEVCARHGYDDDTLPLSPGWALAVRMPKEDQS